MSRFFGLYNPSGNETNQTFESVLNSVDDSRNIFQINENGLFITWSKLSHVELDSYGILSEISICGQFILVGFFRLTFRDDLADKLGIANDVLLEISDSKLALLSYVKWGHDFVYHLEGDFSFVLFNNKSRELLLVRQPCGYSVIYYMEVDGILYFSNDSNLFLQLKQFTTKINWSYFLGLSIRGSVPDTIETLFIDLMSLKNGTYLKWTNSNKKHISTFWVLDNFNKEEYKYHLDYFLELRSRFSFSVKTRIRGKNNGAFLSSGLDSTIVAFYLANELKFKGEKLETYTNYPHYLEKIDSRIHPLVNEAPVVRRFVGNLNNVNPHFFDFPDQNLSNILGVNASYDAYYPIVSSNSGWINAILEHAKASGLINVFNAQSGNFTISFTPDFIYLEYLKVLNFKKLIKGLFYYAKEKKVSLIKSFRVLIVSPIKFKLIQFAQKIKFEIATYKYVSQFFKQKEYPIWSSLKIRKSFFVLSKSHFFSSNKMRKKRLEILLDFGSNRWYFNTLNNSLFCSDPTLDNRLIFFCFSIPIELFYFNATPKYIYKESFKDFIPKEIVFCPYSKIQSYDYIYRLKGDELLTKMLEEISLDQSLVSEFEIKNLKNFYKKLCESPPNDNSIGDLSHFLRCISLILFLKKNKNYTFG